MRELYEPLEIGAHEVCGILPSFNAMYLPHNKDVNTVEPTKAMELASKLIKAGDDHAKFARGIVCYVYIKCQVGWLLEYLTYRAGVEGLSSSSSMHTELKDLSGEALANNKQADLPYKVYRRVEMISYQALRRIYKARKNHRHPDWIIFCDWVATLPLFKELIYPELGD